MIFQYCTCSKQNAKETNKRTKNPVLYKIDMKDSSVSFHGVNIYSMADFPSLTQPHWTQSQKDMSNVAMVLSVSSTQKQHV